MSYSVLGVLVEHLHELKRHANSQIGSLETRIKDLEQRLRDAERERVTFRGVHQDGKAYDRGHAVTRRGSLWIALRSTCGTPGGPRDVDRDWQLAVKRGSL